MFNSCSSNICKPRGRNKIMNDIRIYSKILILQLVAYWVLEYKFWRLCGIVFSYYEKYDLVLLVKIY